MRDLYRAPLAVVAVSLSFCLAGCSGAGNTAPGGDTRDGVEPEPDTTGAETIATDIGPWTGDPCDFSGMEALPGQPASGKSFQVGGFEVSLAEDGMLEAQAPHKSNRVLFAVDTKSGLRLARAHVEATDRQGSFQVTESLETDCGGTTFTQATYHSGRLVLRGHSLGEECAGTPVTVRFCQPMPGHLAFEMGGETLGTDAATEEDRASDATGDGPLAGLNLNAVVLRISAEAGERFFGMGEQFPHDSLNLKGRVIPALVQEAGIGRGDPNVTKVMETLSPGSGGTQESTYYPMAHYLTDRNRSLFLENDEVSFFDFSQDNYTEIRLYSPTLRGQILEGDSPLELIERLTETTGRLPELPDWVHQGAIIALARDVDLAMEHADALEAAGVPLVAIWNQTWCGQVKTFIGEQVLWNWARNTQFHPHWELYKEYLDKNGWRGLCYVSPMVVQVPEGTLVDRELYQEGLENNYYVRNNEGEVLLLTHTAFKAAPVDLSNPAARTWLKSVLLDEMVGKAGCDGWMADYGEALPFDALMFNGESGREYHNRYAVEWVKLNREVLEEAGLLGKALVFTRSGFADSNRYTVAVWQGDQVTSFDRFDGMQSALHGLLNGGFSGISINHNDVGGYTTVPMVGPEYKRTAELFQRWTEMNAFGAILRTHEGNSPGSNVQVYNDAEAMAHFARFTRLFVALAPYRKGLIQEAATKGWPVIRQLAMHYPEDPKAWEVTDQFLLGSEILVAPTFGPCNEPECKRSLYLPQGSWKHAWSDTTYDVPPQGQTVEVQAPIGQPAVFHRVGFAFPEVE